MMDTLRLHVVTWNVAGKRPEPSLSLEELLGLGDPKNPLPDVYVIGLQEVNAQVQNMVLDALFDDPWNRVFRTKLAEKGFVKVRTIRLQGLVLSLFIRRSGLLTIRDLAWEVVRTGLGGMWGNKGATGLRLALGGVSLCLINTHLTPHDHHLEARVNDYNAVVQQMRFPKHLPTEMVFFHDYVIWLGDHNFRLDESVSHEEVLSRIRADELEWLREREQLREVMHTGKAFSELTEPDFRFPPTFKFIFNSSDYDAKRRPAWTDRILYRVTENAYENLTLAIQPEGYTSLPQYLQSDHKPVVCQFKIKVFADHVDRVVEFAPLVDWAIDRENYVTITLSDDVTANDFDWIGIYKANFSSLDEYISFLYINPRPSSEEAPRRDVREALRGPNKRVTITFPDHTVREAGNYCLLYITEDWGSVLGISNVFHARSVHNGSSRTEFHQRRSSFDSKHSSTSSLSVSPNRSRKVSPYRSRRRKGESSSESE